MKQEEFDALSAKVEELKEELEEKKGTMLIVVGDVDSGMLIFGAGGKAIDMAFVLSVCANKDERIKDVLENAVLTTDIASGARAKRKKKAKVLWIATAIVFAILAVIEVATALAIGDVSKVISSVLLNIGLWVLCFVATKAQLRV